MIFKRVVVAFALCFIVSAPLSAQQAATARCRDGSLSYSASRSGTCSRHGGVAEWLAAPSEAPPAAAVPAPPAPVATLPAVTPPAPPVVKQPRDAKGRFVRSGTAKHRFMVNSGYPHGRPGYVIDHIIALACGGLARPAWVYRRG